MKERVAKILAGPALTLPLKSRGIAVAETSAPKQTDTTQRWKASLSVDGRSLPIHTKIEFSRRANATWEDQAVLTPVLGGSDSAGHQLVVAVIR